MKQLLKYTILSLVIVMLSSLTITSEKSFPEGGAKPNYRIELANYEKMVPIAIVEMLREIDGLKLLASKNGTTYYSEPFATEIESEKALNQYTQMGFDQATQVVEYKNIFFKLEDFNKMKEEKSVIRIINSSS